MIIGDIFWALLPTYFVIDFTYNWVRNELGERNLSDKSKIDRRFLV
jgi:hypothetical protein